MPAKSAGKSNDQDVHRLAQDEHFKTHLVEQMLALAILEDLGPEALDVTSAATVAGSKVCQARLELKESSVICGLNIVETVVKCLKPADSTLKMKELFAEGTYVEVKDKPVIVATIEADSQCLLAAERLSLNLMQRMCGVATLARRYTKLASTHGIQILDTRKTMPGLRVFDRRAVLAGGGTNHRFGLFDAILIKDNHVQSAGGVGNAVRKAQGWLQSAEGSALKNRLVEVEVTSMSELSEAIEARAGRVLLDNMTPGMVREAVSIVRKSGWECFIEVSGGVNEGNLESYLIDGVNAISIGAITHSAKNIDLSLEFD